MNKVLFYTLSLIFVSAVSVISTYLFIKHNTEKTEEIETKNYISSYQNFAKELEVINEKLDKLNNINQCSEVGDIVKKELPQTDICFVGTNCVNPTEYDYYIIDEDCKKRPVPDEWSIQLDEKGYDYFLVDGKKVYIK